MAHQSKTITNFMYWWAGNSFWWLEHLLKHASPSRWSRNQYAVLRFRIRDPVPFWPLDPGFGIRDGYKARIRIRDEQPGSYFRELRNNFFGLKYLNSLKRIRDQGWKKFGFGSRIRNTANIFLSATLFLPVSFFRNLGLDEDSEKSIDPDPQRWLLFVCLLAKNRFLS